MADRAAHAGTRPADYNPKDAAVPFVAVAVLDAAVAATIGARDRRLRLTERVAEKQYWRHGPGLAESRVRARDIAARTVPVAWYADIQSIVDRIVPVQQANGRWAFASRVGQSDRLLVVDLDAHGNPVVVSYYGKKKK